MHLFIKWGGLLGSLLLGGVAIAKGDVQGGMSIILPAFSVGFPSLIK